MCEIMEKLVAESTERINALITILINDNRIEDLKRAATDKAYQAELMEELLPDDM